jgi:hypothetical protein
MKSALRVLASLFWYTEPNQKRSEDGIPQRIIVAVPRYRAAGRDNMDAWEINWIMLSMVIGLLTSIVCVVLYERSDRH